MLLVMLPFTLLLLVLIDPALLSSRNDLQLSAEIAEKGKASVISYNFAGTIVHRFFLSI